MSDLPAYMHAEIPDTAAGISADAAGGWIIVTKCGGEVLRFTAQQWGELPSARRPCALHRRDRHRRYAVKPCRFLIGLALLLRGVARLLGAQ